MVASGRCPPPASPDLASPRSSPWSRSSSPPADYVETTPPAPTPADFSGIAIELAKRGLELDNVVSGDAGCDDKVLRPTAIAFDATGLDQATPVRLYLYIFADRATFERLRATIDACARTFVTDPETFESIEESPFVIAAQGPWGTEVRGGAADRAQGRGRDGRSEPGAGVSRAARRASDDPQAQDLAGDDQPLHLAGPLADLGQLGVAQVALDRVVGDVAVAAVDLDRVVGRPAS